MKRRYNFSGEVFSMDHPISGFADYSKEDLAPEKKLWFTVILYAIYDYFQEDLEENPKALPYRTQEYQRELTARQFFFGDDSPFEIIAETIQSDGTDLAQIIRKFLKDGRKVVTPAHSGRKKQTGNAVFSERRKRNGCK